jgi:hypothetical protein
LPACTSTGEQCRGSGVLTQHEVERRFGAPAVMQTAHAGAHREDVPGTTMRAAIR